MISLNKTELKALGKSLKGMREDANLRQHQVADHFGYSSPQFVSNWERGITVPQMNTLRRLCRLYKVSREDMLNVLTEITKRALEREMLRERTDWYKKPLNPRGDGIQFKS